MQFVLKCLDVVHRGLVGDARQAVLVTEVNRLHTKALDIDNLLV